MTDPVGKCGAIKFDAFAGEDLRLSIERQMIAELRDQHMRQQCRSSNAAFHRPRWNRRFHNAIALRTGHLYAHVTNDFIRCRHARGNLRDIFAELVQRSATLLAYLFRRQMRVHFARQRLRQRTPYGLHFSDCVRAAMASDSCVSSSSSLSGKSSDASAHKRCCHRIIRSFHGDRFALSIAQSILAPAMMSAQRECSGLRTRLSICNAGMPVSI